MTVQHMTFAVKQFSDNLLQTAKVAFHRERAMYELLNTSRHAHITSLFASFVRGDQYSLIFPLATEDLRGMWAHIEPHSVERNYYLQEMAGIAEALSYLHNDFQAQEPMALVGYHMDVKPENILIFGETWKLSDFTFSSVQPKVSPLLELPPHPGSGTYEPPACQLELAQTTAYDIWSLGCVLLECLIWYAQGAGAIGAFAEDRLKDSSTDIPHIKDDCFFVLGNGDPNSFALVEVKPAVLNWIEKLQQDKQCVTIIADILNIIKDHLIIVDPMKRMDSAVLSKKLTSLLSEPGTIHDTDLQAVTSIENASPELEATESKPCPPIPR